VRSGGLAIFYGVYNYLYKEEGMKKFTLLGLVVVVLVISFAGCNAFRGAGKDLKDTGHHMENVGK